MRRLRRLPLLLLGPLALAVVAASAAWACVPFPFVSVPAPANGPSGTSVKVNGFEFPEGNAIEVRWNTVDGPVLARATGPEFSADVAVPDAEGGLHVFVVLSRAANGVVTGKAAASFWVGSAPEAASEGPSVRPAAPPASTSDSSGRGLATGASAALGGALLGGGLVGGWALGRRRPTPQPA